MRSRLAVPPGVALGLALPLAVLALATCGTVDLGPPPADVNACRPSQAFFLERIWPEFLNKDYGGRRCNDGGCHDAAGRQSLVLTAPASAPGLPLPADWAAVYRSATEQMRCTNVASSPLLTHPDGRSPHGGMQLIEPEGPEEMLVKMWVTAP
jgi:hypothetical protein